ncbi:MAG: hypothetical protein GVY20_00880 [Bacteroidetes bacterium]|nr:hypothetical protein [Bacteroidota bacterium]
MLQNIYNRFRIFFSSMAFRREVWPFTKKLKTKHIKNCSLVEDRIKMLEKIPKGGVCAEVGILKGDYSRYILDIVKPQKLHLIDIDSKSIKIARKRFEDEIEQNLVEVHREDSSTFLSSVPDATFDWIYIDGDHSYEGVKRDLEAAHSKIKPDGLISLNDYIFFGSSDLTKYGIIEATNEFCIEYDYELVHFALHGRMYNDVTIRRIEKG